MSDGFHFHPNEHINNDVIYLSSCSLEWNMGQGRMGVPHVEMGLGTTPSTLLLLLAYWDYSGTKDC